MITIAEAVATIVPSETPEEHCRTVAQILALAEYGQTAAGEPARIVTDDDFKHALARLIRAAHQLEAEGRAAAVRRLA